MDALTHLGGEGSSIDNMRDSSYTMYVITSTSTSYGGVIENAKLWIGIRKGTDGVECNGVLWKVNTTPNAKQSESGIIIEGKNIMNTLYSNKQGEIIIDTS